MESRAKQEMTKEGVSKLEEKNKFFNLTNREKKIGKNEQSFRNLWDNIKKSCMHYWGLRQKRESYQGRKII